MITQHTVGRPVRSAPGARRDWTVIVALVLLGAIPLVAGALRLVQLAGGPALMPADARVSTFPLPVVVHIVAAAIFIPLGAIQFAPSIRRRHLVWHRRSGRLVFVSGLLVATSALCLTLVYPQKVGTGDLLYVARLLFSSVMAIGLVLALAAIRRRDTATHRAWMIRAYAIGLAAGTQAFTEGISSSIFGAGVVQDDLAKIAGWVINLAIAEWIIRRSPRTRWRTGTAVPAVTGGVR